MGTAEGLGFGVDGSWGNPVEVIPWPAVEAIARAVPDEVRDELVEFRARWREHQSSSQVHGQRGRGRVWADRGR